LLLCIPAFAINNNSGPVFPAEFLRDLLPAGSAETVLRPTAIALDGSSGEILVADSGHDRILIFDAEGVRRFQFSYASSLSSPLSVGVDSEGYIYILGARRDGRSIFRFDYDGRPMGRLGLPDEIDGHPLDLASLALDSENRIYALDRGSDRVCVFSREGEVLLTFDLAESLDPDLRAELLFGPVHIYRDRLFIPLPGLGSVLVYGVDGSFRRSIGHKGGTPGEMSFPIAVAHDSRGMLLVLDKLRCNVLGFDGQGRFLGEFGGKGSHPGWFYLPSFLAVDLKDQVYVGQLFQNKIQVCSIPNLIADRMTSGKRTSSSDGSPLRIVTSEPEAAFPTQRRLIWTARNSRGFENRLSESNKVFATLLEVKP